MIAHLEPLRTECDRFAAAIADADPASRVPSCPDWDLRELVTHLGRVQRSWAPTIRRAEDVEPQRPDAEVASGRPGGPLDPQAAADALDEFLHITVVEHHRWSPWPGPAGVVELAPADGGAARWVVLGPDSPVPSQEVPAAGAGATLSGTASDLVLLLYRRIPLGQVAATGDATLATAFVDWLVVD